MNDLISRQAAIDVLNVLCQEHRYKIPGKGETYSQYNEAWQDALDRAEGAIFNLPSAQPAVDAEPVRYGHWIEHHEPFTWMGYSYWSCSECGFECGYEKDIRFRTNYCPNCGADMRGEKDE